MKFFAGILQRICNIISLITDWILIAAGVILVVKSLYTIDVAGARYTVAGIGVLFFAAGLWFRSRRLRRLRKIEIEERRYQFWS